MAEQTSKAAELKKQLAETRQNGWNRLAAGEEQAVEEFCKGYMDFLAEAKTEREAAAWATRALEAAGFVPLMPDAAYKPGDRVYRVNRDKAVVLAVIGKRSPREGVRIAAAHIDSPRLDLKQHPLYEADELAYLKTHYYGGIRKYQWPTVPMALHGVVVLRDGSRQTVNIGDQPGDPCFVVTDLLPHLAASQDKRTLSDGVRGEELNLLVGSRPFNNDEESEQVKLRVLQLLFERYGMCEADFLSAELEAVPAGRPVEIGFDRSMIGGYGQDDRVCAYPALMAALQLDQPEYTAVTVLTDKEETGSDGNTGLQSAYFRYFIEDLAEAFGCRAREIFSASTCLSADVNAAYDPTFADAFEKRNASYLGSGAVITKYTGARGKYDTSDASAEFTGDIRRRMDAAGVVWQTGELGKVDNGGGGTVAKYIANLDVDTIDLGVPVLCMHAPFEVVSKVDVYMTYRAIAVFFGD